jgi:glycerophosphoryl diester phosphodiesterase
MEVLTEKQFTNRVMFSSFDPQMLAELKNRGLNSQTILLCDEHTLSFIKETFKQPPVEYLSHFSAQLGIFTIAIDHRLIASKGSLHCFKDLKIKVIAWTANEEKDWKRLISYGIDAIITDKPTALANYLQANKKHLLKANLKKGSRRIISALKCPKFP